MKYLITSLLLLAIPAQASEYSEGSSSGFLSNSETAPTDSSSEYQRGFNDAQADNAAEDAAAAQQAQAQQDADVERSLHRDSE